MPTFTSRECLRDERAQQTTKSGAHDEPGVVLPPTEHAVVITIGQAAQAKAAECRSTEESEHRGGQGGVTTTAYLEARRGSAHEIDRSGAAHNNKRIGTDVVNNANPPGSNSIGRGDPESRPFRRRRLSLRRCAATEYEQ